QGGYATHLLAPHPRHLFDIGNLKPEQAAPLACSGVPACSALKKVSATLKDEPVVIIGAGGVGLMGVTLARKMGAKEVIVVDIDAGKREAASKAGANKTIDGGTADAVQQIQAATGGGAWAVIDFVGSSATVGLAVSSIIKGGTGGVGVLSGGALTRPAAFPAVARDDAARLLCGQPNRHGRASRPGETYRHAAGADPHAPPLRRGHHPAAAARPPG